MAISSRYIYDQADYWPLINALRQKNRYRFGALIQEFPIQIPRHTRAFVVPEGVVVLSWTEQKNIKLFDLQKPLYLKPFFIVWNEKNQRLKLQVNRTFVQNKIRIIDEASRHQFRWVDAASVEIKTSEFINFCNLVTREVDVAAQYAWVEPTMLAGYDRRVKRIAMRWLTTVARLPVPKAKMIIRKDLERWWSGQGSRTGYKAWLEQRKAQNFAINGTVALEAVLG